MTDLNDWRLDYPGVSFAFGTYATGFPFITQVDVGTIETLFTDAAHPSTDGKLFGAEKYQGRTLTFEVGIAKVAGAGPRWGENLDAQGEFAAAWDATPVRRVPGAVAELSNLDRARMVYGRPRNLKPKLAKARQGWSELVCDFATVDHLFYSTAAYSTDATVIPESSGGGFTTPIVFPWTSEPPATADDAVNNAGNRDTWPVITINGPILDPMVELLPTVGDPVWTLKLDGQVPAGKQAVIDTRPWRRGVTIDGAPASGLLRGSPIHECVIPPGAHAVRYSGTDATGTAAFAVSWRSAYAGL